MNYNKKIDYQFCKNIVVGTTEEKEQRFRKVFNLKEKPETDNEFKILEHKSMLESLLNTDDIFKELVKIHHSLYDIDLNDIEKNLINQALKITKPDLAYQRIAESCVFDLKIDFIAYIYNAKRIKLGLYPVIFYKELTRIMYGYFRLGNTDEGLEILHKMKRQTESQNQLHEVVNKEIVVNRILAHQELLKSRFGISKLYIYGSCARDEMDEYSDVDIICVVDYHDKNRSAKEISILHIFLAELLNLSIDLKIGDDENELCLNNNIKCDLYKVY